MCKISKIAVRFSLPVSAASHNFLMKRVDVQTTVNAGQRIVLHCVSDWRLARRQPVRAPLDTFAAFVCNAGISCVN
jgi:hypothetical protein